MRTRLKQSSRGDETGFYIFDTEHHNLFISFKSKVKLIIKKKTYFSSQTSTPIKQSGRKTMQEEEGRWIILFEVEIMDLIGLCWRRFLYLIQYFVGICVYKYSVIAKIPLENHDFGLLSWRHLAPHIPSRTTNKLYSISLSFRRLNRE